MHTARLTPTHYSFSACLPLAALLWIGAAAFGGPHSAVAGGDAEQQAPALIAVRGRLAHKKAKRGDAQGPEHFVIVGARRYVLGGVGDVPAKLKKLRGKYVAFEIQPPEPKQGDIHVLLSDAAAIKRQAPARWEGLASVVKGNQGAVWYVSGLHGEYAVSKRDGRRFKSFADQNVEVEAFVTSDDRYGCLEKVSSVERKLLPGERDPKDGLEAIIGSWRGTLTATKIPKGVPGATLGDYPLSFVSPAKAGVAKGRLMDAYDVVGKRVREFNRKKRRITFDVEYSFGQGSYAIRCEGVLSQDWKSIDGTWKSGFLGSGTLKLRVATDKDGN